MLKDVNASPLKEEVERSRIGRYLQKPFYFARSKLAALFEALLGSRQAETSQTELTYHASEEYKPEFGREPHFYCRFTDRVDPSLYYTVFFPHRRF